ncbi:Lrp/AsnC family transcriptional regulator [Brevibacillus humidisoli]|uniref:Lrp/AsnC family transcriptional regulator n=1 Tax=Brevibacillus humidisoli TaxID=2895522 RepID=UPI001E5CDAAE|nr:Lrp/AsnC family transcriptional regulator [Brevibacillus humidisoli]UFJ42222.1 Lrp/AsnC family transcriptional regulator [Brevibacillus humidisoli]
MIDRTDREILHWLKQDARMQWKEIGEKVHLTGQAVAARIRRLEEMGVIEGFTVKLDQAKLGHPITALVTVFMKSSNHRALWQFLADHPMVEEAYRISGEGCFWLKVSASSQKELNHFLDDVLRYGNYRLNLSIEKIR